jgi:predicted transcriptional regulator
MDHAVPADAIATPTPLDDEVPAPVTIKEKWQGAVTEGSGFVAVPVALLRLQSKYDLTATDMLVLINLLAHWWDPQRAVYPRSTTIAKRMGIAKRTVQRSTHKLESAGLLTRDYLEDGRRIFTFDRLAQRLADDVPTAYLLQAQESHGS